MAFPQPAIEKLDQVVLLARAALAASVRDELAADMLERIDYLSQSHLTPEQRAEVRRRLALPARHAPEAAVKAVFAKYRSLS